MPYAITTFDYAPGIASYQLGGHEEWSLRSLTVLFTFNVGAGSDSLFVDVLTSGGSVVDRQPLCSSDGSVFVSAGFGAADFTLQSGGTTNFPQLALADQVFVSVKLKPLTLAAPCTLRLYASTDYGDATVDPASSLDASVTVGPVLLWVEDTNALGRNLPDVANPILLGVG